MSHTASCDNATTRECRCGGCAGSQHGWSGALSLAEPTMAGAREQELTNIELRNAPGMTQTNLKLSGDRL